MGNLFSIASDDEVSILILIQLNTHSNASGMNRWDSRNLGLWVLKVDDDIVRILPSDVTISGPIGSEIH